MKDPDTASGTDLASLYQRLRDRIVENETGCDIWQGAVTGKKYPALRFRGDLWAIHRLLAILEFGSMPDGHEVDHQIRLATRAVQSSEEQRKYT